MPQRYYKFTKHTKTETYTIHNVIKKDKSPSTKQCRQAFEYYNIKKYE